MWGRMCVCRGVGVCGGVCVCVGCVCVCVCVVYVVWGSLCVKILMNMLLMPTHIYHCFMFSKETKGS